MTSRTPAGTGGPTQGAKTLMLCRFAVTSTVAFAALNLELNFAGLLPGLGGRSQCERVLVSVLLGLVFAGCVVVEERFLNTPKPSSGVRVAWGGLASWTTLGAGIGLISVQRAYFEVLWSGGPWTAALLAGKTRLLPDTATVLSTIVATCPYSVSVTLRSLRLSLLFQLVGAVLGGGALAVTFGRRIYVEIAPHIPMEFGLLGAGGFELYLLAYVGGLGILVPLSLWATEQLHKSLFPSALRGVPPDQPAP